MKNAMQKWISIITILCLLLAALTGCGNSEITEVSASTSDAQQENHAQKGEDQKQENKPMDAPEMASVQVPEEDVQALIQAGLDAAVEESGLWEITEITDTDILMQLMQGQSGGRERPEGENFDGERPEMPDGESKERPDGDMPEGGSHPMDGENPPENMEGTFPEGEMPEGNPGRGEGGSRQHGNRGGGKTVTALVISSTEAAELAADEILAQIQLTAEAMGYQTSSMELTEEQQSVIEVPDGHSVKLVVLVNTQMPEMELGEAEG